MRTGIWMWLALFIGTLGVPAASAADVALIAGPMVGHVTDRSARVWMQLPIAGEVTLTAVDSDRNVAVSALRIDVVGPSPFICDVPVNNLEPDHAYRIVAEFEGKPWALPGPPLVVRTAPTPGEEVPLTIGFGSGMHVVAGNSARVPAAPIFKGITEMRPRAFLFLGNSGYLPQKLEEFPTARRPAFRLIADLHSAVRQLPDLQPLLRSTPCYGIFDDRDFGTPDADSTFVFKPESLVAFQRFWANPNWGTPQFPGCYAKTTFGDVDIFLLDIRTYRDSPLPSPATTQGAAVAAVPRMLGEAQMQWLQRGLRESKATFKILAAPCVLFEDGGGGVGGEGWSRFPAEQAAFFRWLGEQQVSGLLALAGNQPAGQLLQYQFPAGSGMRYPILTLGCSTLMDVPREARRPLAAGGGGGGAARPVDVVQQNNFGSLTFGGQREKRFVTLRIHDEGGRVRVEQTVFGGQLRNP